MPQIKHTRKEVNTIIWQHSYCFFFMIIRGSLTGEILIVNRGGDAPTELIISGGGFLELHDTGIRLRFPHRPIAVHHIPSFNSRPTPPSPDPPIRAFLLRLSEWFLNDDSSPASSVHMHASILDSSIANWVANQCTSERWHCHGMPILGQNFHRLLLLCVPKCI